MPLSVLIIFYKHYTKDSLKQTVNTSFNIKNCPNCYDIQYFDNIVVICSKYIK